MILIKNILCAIVFLINSEMIKFVMNYNFFINEDFDLCLIFNNLVD